MGYFKIVCKIFEDFLFFNTVLDFLEYSRKLNKIHKKKIPKNGGNISENSKKIKKIWKITLQKSFFPNTDINLKGYKICAKISYTNYYLYES